MDPHPANERAYHNWPYLHRRFSLDLNLLHIRETDTIHRSDIGLGRRVVSSCELLMFMQYVRLRRYLGND